MVERRAIELIPKEVEAAKGREVLLKRLRLFSFGFFLLCFLIAGGIFGFSWTLSTQLNNLKQESSKQEAQIAQFAEVEFKVLGLSDKSAALSTILTQRDYFSLGLSAVNASRPSNLRVTGFDVQKDKDIVTINGETSSYVVLATFMQNLVDPNKGGVLFIDAVLSSVNLNSATGTAEFVIEATIQKNGFKKPLDSEEGA